MQTTRSLAPPTAVRARYKSPLKTITSEDFILPVGNPTLIGVTIALAADQLEGNVSVLQWLGKEKEYIPISAKLWS